MKRNDHTAVFCLPLFPVSARGGRNRALCNRFSLPVGIGAIALLMLLFHGSLRAQSSSPAPLILAGGEYGLGWSNTPVFPGSADCGTYSAASSVAPRVGIGLRMPDLPADGWGLQARLGWSFVSGEAVAEPVSPFLLFDAGEGGYVSVPYEYRLDWSGGLLGVEVAADMEPMEGLRISGGIWGGIPFGTVIETAEFITDEEHRFSGGERSRPIPGGAEYGPGGPMFGLVVGGSYGLPVGEMLMLRPEIYVRPTLGGPVDGGAWGHVLAGAGLVLEFGSEPQAPSADPSSIPIAVPALPPAVDDGTASGTISILSPRNLPAPPVALLRLYCRAGEQMQEKSEEDMCTVRVRFYEEVYRITATLPSFLESEATLPGVDTATFVPDSLAEMPYQDRAARMLNVIGYRMVRNDTSRLLLSGGETAGAGEPGGDRIERVRRYLTEVWGIGRERVVVRNEAGASERTDGRIYLAAEPAELLGPLHTAGVRRDIDRPALTVEPAFEAGAGVRRWGITFRYGRDIVGEYASDRGDSLFRIDWTITGDTARSGGEFLTAELYVEDSLGREAVSRDSVGVKIERNVRLVDRMLTREQRRTRLSLYNEEGRPDEQRNVSIVNDIAEGIGNGARITVIGYDSISSAGNFLPTTERADTVAELLKKRLNDRGIQAVVVIASQEERPDHGSLSEDWTHVPEVEILIEEVDEEGEEPPGP